ncbi:hypothetical protein GCM10018966_072070 [Streptomyces yanii]
MLAGARTPPVRSHPVTIELSVELIELERAAWAEQQENLLTVETAEVFTSNTERAHAPAP